MQYPNLLAANDARRRTSDSEIEVAVSDALPYFPNAKDGTVRFSHKLGNAGTFVGTETKQLPQTEPTNFIYLKLSKRTVLAQWPEQR